ncbi:DNA binding domain-containing protein, excisionase family [Georgenia satyanarayanai]|uniref:DNA binding domain-containing protein, excisionase family n=1 Tax=Georgenia satyanarayanai TaxID=860221 RepID=A0A2Y9AL40_9MICO|nr:helix-turn-helix domain-containing protein [Georgenia satyanarayanai]PYF99066.1 excisionase family DNA binding protein [Georgenia satyanarayanai]SSA44028.1 DNA binding domain-containing protein, excisionase family [Georgenia satyanarayanai]
MPTHSTIVERRRSAASDMDPFLKVPEVAAYLGTSERYVRNLVADGCLTTFRPGRRVLVRRSAVDAFITAHTSPAVGR